MKKMAGEKEEEEARVRRWKGRVSEAGGAEARALTQAEARLAWAKLAMEEEDEAPAGEESPARFSSART